VQPLPRQAVPRGAPQLPGFIQKYRTDGLSHDERMEKRKVGWDDWDDDQYDPTTPGDGADRMQHKAETGETYDQVVIEGMTEEDYLMEKFGYIPIWRTLRNDNRRSIQALSGARLPAPQDRHIGANGGDSHWICFRHLERWNQTHPLVLADVAEENGWGCRGPGERIRPQIAWQDGQRRTNKHSGAEVSLEPKHENQHTEITFHLVSLPSMLSGNGSGRLSSTMCPSKR
jgi:hypothetical protein